MSSLRYQPGEYSPTDSEPEPELHVNAVAINTEVIDLTDSPSCSQTETPSPAITPLSKKAQSVSSTERANRIRNALDLRYDQYHSIY